MRNWPVFRTYIDIIIKFYPPRTVQLNLFQGLSNHIVRLAFRLLGCFNHSGFIDIASIFDVKLAKSVLQAKYLVLLKLRILSVATAPLANLIQGPNAVMLQLGVKKLREKLTFVI